jgi:hypothetical protein
MVVGQLAHILDQEIVLHAGPGNAHGIHFLEGILADGRGGNLAGDHHHGNGIHVGGGDTRHRVGGAGAGCHDGHADLAGTTGVGVGRMDGRLLMAHQDVLEILLLVDFVIDVEYRAARVPEDVLDTFVAQTADNDFRTGQFHVSHGEKFLIF